ncbi:MAG: type II toxin-antitoxin system HicB family antitoxin [Synergistaceae bacterium]|nr:type II toxin-antitoxin system HicB family antitoxin [Synergistaceae bacterium]
MSTFTAMIHREGDFYVAECPETGTVSQGLTMEEALNNLREATELYLEETSFVPQSRAFITTFEATCHA